MSNEITAYFKGTTGVAESVYQYDYGMIMNIDGLTLSNTFDVHFEKSGSSSTITAVGSNDRVVIPSDCLAVPGKLTAYIYTHTGSHDGETAYVVTFQVINRARPDDDITDATEESNAKAIVQLRTEHEEDVSKINNNLDAIENNIDDVEVAATALTARVTTAEDDIDSLETQFTTVVSAVTTDTEVTNIRVGDDGITYSTAGEAVRNQFSDVKSAFNYTPIDARQTNFAELSSADLNPTIALKELDKNYKQFNNRFVNASLKFTENSYYTTYVFRLPFYGMELTCSATKIFICKDMPSGDVGETLDVIDTVTTSGSVDESYTLNYEKGSVVVVVWNTNGVNPDKVNFRVATLVPYTEPRLKLTTIQNNFDIYAKKDSLVLSSVANDVLGIIKYTGKILASASGNTSDNSSYDTYSFQVPVESMTIKCTNGYRCTKSYFAPDVYTTNENLIALVYGNSDARVETFTATYKQWVSISINKNSYPDGLELLTDLAHPFTLPTLKLSVGQSPAFYKYHQETYSAGTQRYLEVFYKSGDNKVVRWGLKNTPSVESNSDTWQLDYVFGYDFDGVALSNGVSLVKNGEFELAFKEHGAVDYCGGINHGDETSDSFKLFIDGKYISDLTTLDGAFHPFNRIDAFEIATVNRCNTPAEDIIKHQKRWTFENGKVTVNETIKTLEALSVDGMLCCMFPAYRSAFPYGIRQGRVEIEDMTTSSYTSPETVANEFSYFMYGNNCTAKITSKLCEHTPLGDMWINPTDELNKLYYGFWGATDSANPVAIPQGAVVWWENEYDVAYN